MQFHPPRLNGGPVPPPRLLEHHLRVIHARHKSLHRNLAHSPDVHARSESHFEHAIFVVNFQQRQHPPASLLVTKCHEVTGEPAWQSRRTCKLLPPAACCGNVDCSRGCGYRHVASALSLITNALRAAFPFIPVLLPPTLGLCGS